MSTRGIDAGEKANLLKIELLSNRAEFRCLPGFPPNDSRSRDRMLAGVDCDEVYPNIFVGDELTAKNKKYLKMIGITHVVNTAEGANLGMVNTCQEFYSNTRIKYKGIQLSDLSVSDASKYFYEVSEFIDDALKSDGRVLVHCMMGMSRSGTFAIAYLMIKKGMNACEAVRTIRMRRNIHPNDGFLHQLAVLDNRLFRNQQIFD